MGEIERKIEQLRAQLDKTVLNGYDETCLRLSEQLDELLEIYEEMKNKDNMGSRE